MTTYDFRQLVSVLSIEQRDELEAEIQRSRLTAEIDSKLLPIEIDWLNLGEKTLAFRSVRGRLGGSIRQNMILINKEWIRLTGKPVWEIAGKVFPSYDAL